MLLCSRGKENDTNENDNNVCAPLILAATKISTFTQTSQCTSKHEHRYTRTRIVRSNTLVKTRIKLVIKNRGDNKTVNGTAN